MIIENEKHSSRCAFIIVTYNSKNDIYDCIYSIKKFHPESGIFVIDNNSSDGTAEILNKIQDINLTILPVNSGFSGGNNLAIKKAIDHGFDFFFLFNPDSRLTQKILHPLINLAIEQKALVGPVIRHFNSGEIQSIGGTYNKIFSSFYLTKEKKIYKSNSIEVNWILGAALLISKEIILNCGYLDENFFPATFEDASYCIEAKKKGFKSFIDLQTNILHKGATSSGGDRKYLLRIIKNKYYYALTYQNNLFFITTIFENTLRFLYHKYFGILKQKNSSSN